MTDCSVLSWATNPASEFPTAYLNLSEFYNLHCFSAVTPAPVIYFVPWQRILTDKAHNGCVTYIAGTAASTQGRIVKLELVT